MRIAVIAALLTATATAIAQEPPGEWEVGWAEEFDSAENWYPISYTLNPARDFSFSAEDGIGHFRVGDRGRAMRWMTTPGGVNLVSLSIPPKQVRVLVVERG